MDSGFIVTLVAHAILVMLVAERNGIVTQDMGGNALLLERFPLCLMIRAERLKEKP